MIRRKQKSARRRSNKGALFVIATLFLFSGILRLGGEAGTAIAREVEALTQAVTPEAGAVAQMCENPEGLAELLAALKTRETRVAAKEEALANRVQALAVTEAEVARNLARLEEAEAALADTMALADRAAEDDLTRLTAVYETMKPKQAAALFEEMNEEFSAGFLARMRPDAAAAVMAGLSPKKAYAISVVMAGRNADVPTADAGAQREN